MSANRNLLIPQAIWDDIHPMSGYIYQGSKFNNKTVYGLFMTPENVQYVTAQITRTLGSLIQGCSIERMMKDYRKIKTPIVESESVIQNPVIELAYRNREFIMETVKNIRLRNRIDSPEAHHQNNLMAYQNIADTTFQEVDWGTRYAHLGEPGRNVYRWGNRIAPDRISAQQREIDRDITEGLRDTRQLETPIHGYDMSALTSQSSNRAFDNNEYTSY